MRGQGRVFLRNSTYWISYYVEGKEYRESAKTSEIKDAEKFLQARLDERGAARIGARTFVTPRACKMTVGELVDALAADFELRGKASPQNTSYFSRVKKDFGDYRAVTLKSEQIADYTKQRLADGSAPASVNRVLQLLGQAFKLAVKREHLNRVPCITYLKEDNVRSGFFTEQELAAVIEHLPENLQDITLWCAATGMRRGEASKLTFSMLAGDVLQIPKTITKNSVARSIPLTGELAEIIERRRERRTVEVDGRTVISELIFHKGGKRLPQCRKEWDRACVAAGCPGRLFHDLRRFAVRNLIHAGVEQAIAMKVSGHKTVSMFQRYNIILTDDMRRAMEQTEQYRQSAAKSQAKIVAMR